jgi:hypothetical protein
LFIKTEIIAPENVQVQGDGTVIYTPTIKYKDLLCGCTIKCPGELKVNEDIVIPPLSVKTEWKMVIANKGLFWNENYERRDMIVQPKIDWNMGEVDIEKLREAFKE